jgi:tRNA modification GTPase
MLLRTDDTIVAIASASGGALRGIVRVSGPQCLAVAQTWFEPADGQSLDGLRQPTVVPGAALLPDAATTLPGDLWVWPSERSYTRQPTVEFHTLGSPPLLQRLVHTICRCGARLAGPGEFTLRAFLAGRLDLTQAEAVLGVIDAGSQRELNVALRQLAGGLAAPLNELRSMLLDVLAHLEAGLDFVEEDIEFISTQQLRAQLVTAQERVQSLLEKMQSRSTAATHYRVALYGRPNVGKSSLLNVLAQSQRAIVSAVAGTTRDYVTAQVECGGLPCLLIDTAGVAEPGSDAQSLDQAAQDSSRDQAEQAHVRLFCLDATRPLDAWEQSELARQDERRLVVLTKCEAARPPAAGGLLTSSRTGQGLAELQQAIADKLASLQASHQDAVAGTATRCRDSLQRALDSLAAAIDAVNLGVGEEIVAGEIRVVLEELGTIAGAVYTDDILDRIFSRFCIGK